MDSGYSINISSKRSSTAISAPVAKIVVCTGKCGALREVKVAPVAAKVVVLFTGSWCVQKFKTLTRYESRGI